jgi:hypothetical protein
MAFTTRNCPESAVSAVEVEARRQKPPSQPDAPRGSVPAMERLLGLVGVLALNE